MENLTHNSNFSIKDLYLAALIYAKGVKLETVTRQGKSCWFVFRDKQTCESYQRKFFAKEVEVNAKDYSDAIRTLKDLVFSGS